MDSNIGCAVVWGCVVVVWSCSGCLVPQMATQIRYIHILTVSYPMVAETFLVLFVISEFITAMKIVTCVYAYIVVLRDNAIRHSM